MILLHCLIFVPDSYCANSSATFSNSDVKYDIDFNSNSGFVDRKLWANIGYDALYAGTIHPEWKKAYDIMKQYNIFQYVRCHNYFTDGNRNRLGKYLGCRIYSEKMDGSSQYDFKHLDEVLDVIIGAGAKPIFECTFMPDALASGPEINPFSGGNLTPPKDYVKWRDMVRATIRHCISRYGLDEVLAWYFEIWNEPNLLQYWAGTKTSKDKHRSRGRASDISLNTLRSFLKLYDYFADAVKGVDTRLQIGGPATASADPDFLRIFLQHCAYGNNFVSGKKGTPIDFISWHKYGCIEKILQNNQKGRKIVKNNFSQFANLPIFLTEFGQPFVINRKPNLSETFLNSYEAAKLCHFTYLNLKRIPGCVDMFLWWGFLVREGFPLKRTIFNSIDGKIIPTPLFNAYRLLARLLPTRLKAESDINDNTVYVIPTKDNTGNVSILVYSFQEANKEGRGKAASVKIILRNLPNKQYTLHQSTIDNNTANGFSRYKRMGLPKYPSRDEVDSIAQQAMLSTKSKNIEANNGVIVISRNIEINSVVLFELAFVAPSF